MSGFTYGKSLTRAGLQWYCQTPGIRWATDPDTGWELYLTAEGTGPATWFLMGNGVEINTGERGLKAAMDQAQKEIAKRAPEAYRIQCAERPDSMSTDGHVGYQLPWPVVAKPDGSVWGAHDHWNGMVTRVIGFQKDPVVQRLDLGWSDFLLDPQQAVGMYLVTSDKDGTWGTHDTAVDSVDEMGAPA